MFDDPIEDAPIEAPVDAPVDPAPAPEPAPEPEPAPYVDPTAHPTPDDVRTFDNGTPLSAPDAQVVIEFPDFEHIGPAVGFDEPSDTSVTCVVCGRSFDPEVPNAKCESRPNVDASCCPHAYCNQRSPFAV